MSSNAVKAVYIFISGLFQIVCIVLAFLSNGLLPAIFWIALCILASMGMSARMNSWGDFGDTNNE